MAAFIPGLAAPNIPLYDSNTDVQVFSPPGLGADPLPPNGSLSYLNSNMTSGPVKVSYNYDLVVVLAVTTVGNPENSTIALLVKPNVARPTNYRYDSFGSVGLFVPINTTTTTTIHFSGIVSMIDLQNVCNFTITRNDGEPTASVAIQQMFVKSKKLD